MHLRTATTWLATLAMAGLLAAGCDLDTGAPDDKSTPSGTSGSGGGPSSGGSITPGTTGTFTALAPLNAARYRHTATLLTDGRILVCGGRSTIGTALGSAEIFDPATGQWAIPAGGTQGLAYARYGHTATLLANGQVLIAGGTNGSSNVARIELFDPSTNAFTAGAGLATPRYNHTAVRLANGNVYIAGGTTGTSTLNTAQIWVAASGQLKNVNNAMLQARELHVAVPLATGAILLAGGQDWIGPVPTLLTINTCELFTPGGADGENGIYVATDALAGTRAMARAVRIGSGTAQAQVLAIGGYTNNPTTGVFDTVELFDAAAGTNGRWTSVVATMANGRYAHTADGVSGGRVLIAGGQWSNAPELLDPYGQTGSGGVDQTATIARTKSTAVPTAMGGVTLGRSWHASVVTGNGLVVLIGGLDGGPTAASSSATASCEYFTP